MWGDGREAQTRSKREALAAQLSIRRGYLSAGSACHTAQAAVLPYQVSRTWNAHRCAALCSAGAVGLPQIYALWRCQQDGGGPCCLRGRNHASEGAARRPVAQLTGRPEGSYRCPAAPITLREGGESDESYRSFEVLPAGQGRGSRCAAGGCRRPFDAPHPIAVPADQR